jgi:hypothetical protein
MRDRPPGVQPRRATVQFRGEHLRLLRERGLRHDLRAGRGQRRDVSASLQHHVRLRRPRDMHAARSGPAARCLELSAHHLRANGSYPSYVLTACAARTRPPPLESIPPPLRSLWSLRWTASDPCRLALDAWSRQWRMRTRPLGSTCCTKRLGKSTGAGSCSPKTAIRLLARQVVLAIMTLSVVPRSGFVHGWFRRLPSSHPRNCRPFPDASAHADPAGPGKRPSGCHREVPVRLDQQILLPEAGLHRFPVAPRRPMVSCRRAGEDRGMALRAGGRG